LPSTASASVPTKLIRIDSGTRNQQVPVTITNTDSIVEQVEAAPKAP
jgi:hypothetical protein